MTDQSAKSEPDPSDVPVAEAATVMLIEDRPELHVLLVRRTSKVVFGPDNWVFPGGRVDPDDSSDEAADLCLGLNDSEASALLDVEAGGLSWWVAACRETLEEAGLLLAADKKPDPALVAELRAQVLQDESSFVDLLVGHDIKLKVDDVKEVARFVTPVGPPRRFDTRFFVALAPDGQLPSHDDGEIVSWEWMRPQDALDRFATGDMQMMSPTIRMVACLSRYGSAAEVMAAAHQRHPYQRVRVSDPKGAYVVLLPGEPGYETAELEVESGWVRLWQPPTG